MTDAIRDGQEAARLLDHPLLTQAFEQIEQDLRDSWLNSPARDEGGREKLWLMTQMLHRVRKQLYSVVENGKVMEATLQQSKATEIANYLSSR